MLIIIIVIVITYSNSNNNSNDNSNDNNIYSSFAIVTGWSLGVSSMLCASYIYIYIYVYICIYIYIYYVSMLCASSIVSFVGLLYFNEFLSSSVVLVLGRGRAQSTPASVFNSYTILVC